MKRQVLILAAGCVALMLAMPAQAETRKPAGIAANGGTAQNIDVSSQRRHYRRYHGPRRVYVVRRAYWGPRRVYWGPRYRYWGPRYAYWRPRPVWWGPRYYWRPRPVYWAPAPVYFGPRYYWGGPVVTVGFGPRWWW
ncbi:MAG: hypothetical protein ACOY5F_08525 [Pseudomonadota bacterium]